ncbi:MAG: alanyl-tRNA editing protein [archaeon]|nr:alanyl-tRNA editing protein [archaeon]
MAKLYLDDSYLKECEAIVTKVVDAKFVELDQTIFYSQGGGQPSDSGKIVKENGEEARVVFAKAFGENISHQIEPEGILNEGEKVRCVLDWEKRHKHMRMHTCAHILAGVINKEIGALITGNQLGEEESRMDFNVPEFDKELLKTFEQKGNEIISRGLEITVSYEAREKALARPELFRLKDVLPKDIPMLRIVSIGDFDIQADGGTHVANTREIGKMKITNFKNKGAQNRRIYWTLSENTQ